MIISSFGWRLKANNNMSFFPFVIGVSASVGYSFVILERISDRRLISFHRSDFDEFLTKNLYKAVSKLNGFTAGF
jgi:predicted component of type VI protein secretion system